MNLRNIKKIDHSFFNKNSPKVDISLIFLNMPIDCPQLINRIM